MCKWCDNPKCTITKEQVLQRGPILESDVTEIMHPASEYGPATYAFAGQPCFDSYSALIPDANEETPTPTCVSALMKMKERRTDGRVRTLKIPFPGRRKEKLC